VTRRGNTISFIKKTQHHVEPINQCPANATFFGTELLVMVCGLVVHHIWCRMTVSWGEFVKRRIWEQSARAHTHTNTHTLLDAQYRQFINNNFQSLFFLGGGDKFSTTWQLCLKVQGVYLQFLLQHAVLHYSHLSLAFHGFVLLGFANSRVVPRIKYITRTLQWIRASESLDDSNRSSNHTAWVEGKQTVALLTVLLQRKEKH
jgi:hypothetical protein